jgi:MFS family permease
VRGARRPADRAHHRSLEGLATFELLLTLTARTSGIFYGWPMLAGLSVAETISWGILYYTFPVFLRPMEIELGWSRAEVAGAFSVALLVSGLAAVPVGRWLDAHGARGLMAAGSAAGALLLFAWSKVQSLAGLYVLWAGFGAVMAAVLYEPAFAVVARWFVRRRNRALTILTVFGALASAVFVPLATWLLDRHGWRVSVQILALLLAVTTVPLHGLLLRRDPRDVGSGPDGEAAAASPFETASSSRPDRGPSLQGLTIVFTVASLVGVATCVHLVPFLTASGVPSAAVAAAVGLLGLMQIPGRLLYGALRRTLPLSGCLAAVFLAQAAALAFLPWALGATALVVFAAVFGMTNGVATLLRASAVAELFGAAEYGRRSGVLALFTTTARAAGPLAAALAYEAVGSYGPVFRGLATLMAVAALSSLLLAGRTRDFPGALPEVAS